MFEGLPIGDISGPAAFIVIAVLVITEKLVWHKRLDIIQKQLETVQEEKAELLKQNTMLLGSAIPTVNSVLGALHAAAGEVGSGSS